MQRFTVSSSAIVDARKQDIELAMAGSELILVTCEPTNAFSYRGPYRLVVTADATDMQEPKEQPATWPDKPEPWLLADGNVQ